MDDGASARPTDAVPRRPRSHAGTDENLDHVVDVYRRHQDRVRAVCALTLGDAAAAEDATQETFLRAASHLPELRPEVVRSYLLSVARSVCADELRLRQRRGRTAEALRGLVAPTDPEALATERRLLVAVWGRLAPREKLLVLHRFAGYSYDEIAHRLGMSTTAVGVALIRTRRKARRLLDQARPLAALLAFRRRRRGSSRALRAPVHGRVVRLMVTVVTVAALSWTLLGGATAPSPSLRPSAATPDAPLRGVVIVDATSWEASPAVVYLTGYDLRGCGARQVCAVLLRSSDGGGSWQRLSAAGFEGGHVLVPAPGLPSRTVLVSGPHGLQRSDDGGASFRTVVRIPGTMAMLSDVRTRRASVLILSRPAWRYDVDAGTLDPGPALPAAMRDVDEAVTAPDLGHVLLAGRRTPGGTPVAEVERCDTASCTTVWRASDGGGGVHLVQRSGEIVVATLHRLALTADDGRTWRAVALPGGVDVEAAAPGAAAGEVVVATHRGGGTHLEVERGGAWIALPPPPGATVRWLVVLAHGRILLVTTTTACSTDDGRGWQPVC